MSIDTLGTRHGLSFDIECYRQIQWQEFGGRTVAPTAEVERNTAWILDELDSSGVQATFFVLGNVALAFPDLVRRMVAEGHEVGVHGFDHRRVTTLDPDGFRSEIERAVEAITDAGAPQPTWHRAPVFSVVNETLWALDVLRDLGFRYDSSIFPVADRRYGISGVPRTPYRLANGMWEVPLTVVDWRGVPLRAAGGGYTRLLPMRYTEWALDRCEAEGRGAALYFHPHEFEPTRPRTPWRLAISRPSVAFRSVRFNAQQGIGRGRRLRERLRKLLRTRELVPLSALIPADA